MGLADHPSGNRKPRDLKRAEPVAGIEAVRPRNSTRLEWRTFEETFSDRTRPILERSAPGFFQVVNLALQRDVFVALARLTDSPTTGKYANVSLKALLDALPVETTKRKRAAMDARLAKMEADVALLRTLRNKLLAHNDRDHALGSLRVQQASRQTVRRVLKGATTVVRMVAEVLTPERIPRCTAFYPQGGAGKLVRILWAADLSKHGRAGDASSI